MVQSRVVILNNVLASRYYLSRCYVCKNWRCRLFHFCVVCVSTAIRAI